RVDLASAPRPLFAKHIAYLRRERRSVVASQTDLRALFEHSPPIPVLSPVPESHMPSDLGGVSELFGGDGLDLALRVSGGLGLLAGELDHTRFQLPARESILDVLPTTLAQEWAGRW